MNAKRILYVAAGILLLAVASILDAKSAKAEWDTTLTGPIVGGDRKTFYTASGEAWELVETQLPSWQRTEAQVRFDLPVPASEVKFFNATESLFIITTRSGDFWVINWGKAPPDPWSYWRLCPPFPGRPIQTQGKTMSDVKSSYRK